jgi:hypothetical protein
MNVHQTIVEGVKEQLFYHNYLVLPGFGGFVLKRSPAHFSASGGMLFPPSKTISFNAQLKQNDGILVMWLQKRLQCNASEALQHLSDFAEYCRSILVNKGRLNIEGLGFFYADLEHNICFEPQQQINFLSSSFGLGPISLKEIESNVSVLTENIFVDRKPDATESQNLLTPKRKRSIRKIALTAFAGIALTSSLLFIVSNSFFTGKFNSSVFRNENKLSYSSISYQEMTLSNLIGEKKAYVVGTNGIASLELDHNKTIFVRAIENNASESMTAGRSKNTSVVSSHKKFEIVLGCFSILNNARRMVRNLKSRKVSAELATQNYKGMYVVRAGAFATKEEATDHLLLMKDAFPHAWIKKAE